MMRHLETIVLLACLAAAVRAVGAAPTPAPAPAPAPADRDSRVAGRIVGAALVESRAYEKLAHLCDRIGHRLSGSKALEHGVAWAVSEFKKDGLKHVWTEAVKVPHWQRGAERGQIVAPVRWELAVLGLGGTVATPPAGLEGDVIEVTSFEELEQAGDAVRGKIVLFNRAMARGFDSEQGYGAVAKLRVEGASRAARQGAAGMLVRSLGTADFRLPHTGALRYAKDAPQIPAAAIAAEDAALLHRLLASAERVRVRLTLDSRTLPDAESANVLAELRGRERPEEIVLIGAHLDSWDVGQGAIDDGAGCAMVMETMRLLSRHGLIPRRTIRAVLFTNEENGLRGGKDYARRHGTEHHVAAIESDSGAARPLGFGVTAGPGGIERVREISRDLAILSADAVHAEGGGADISPLKAYGVPRLSLMQDPTHYFDFHHTQADTLDKVDRKNLDHNVAALALMAYMLAEHGPLPRPPVEAVEDD